VFDGPGRARRNKLKDEKGRPLGGFGQALTLDEAEVLARGEPEEVREFLRLIYGAGYRISRVPDTDDD